MQNGGFFSIFSDIFKKSEMFFKKVHALGEEGKREGFDDFEKYLYIDIGLKNKKAKMKNEGKKEKKKKNLTAISTKPNFAAR